MKPKKPNVPVTMDTALLAEIDRAASRTSSSRSEVMRQSIRLGLPQLVNALSQGETPKPSTARLPRAKRAAVN